MSGPGRVAPAVLLCGLLVGCSAGARGRALPSSGSPGSGLPGGSRQVKVTPAAPSSHLRSSAVNSVPGATTKTDQTAVSAGTDPSRTSTSEAPPAPRGLPGTTTTAQPITVTTFAPSSPSESAPSPTTSASTVPPSPTTNPPPSTGYIYELSKGSPDQQDCPPVVIAGNYVQDCRVAPSAGQETLVEVYSGGGVLPGTQYTAPGGTASTSPGGPGVDPTITMTFVCSPPTGCGSGAGLLGDFAPASTTETISVRWSSPGGLLTQNGTANSVQPVYDTYPVAWGPPSPPSIEVGLMSAPVPVG